MNKPKDHVAELAAFNALQHKANLKRFGDIKKQLKIRNYQVDLRFTNQDILLQEIKLIATEGRDQGKKTNGRVTQLEDVVAPINSAYEKFKLLLAVAACTVPFVSSFFGHVADQIWDAIFKATGHG